MNWKSNFSLFNTLNFEDRSNGSKVTDIWYFTIFLRPKRSFCSPNKSTDDFQFKTNIILHSSVKKTLLVYKWPTWPTYFRAEDKVRSLVSLSLALQLSTGAASAFAAISIPLIQSIRNFWGISASISNRLPASKSWTFASGTLSKLLVWSKNWTLYFFLALLWART